MSAVPSPRPTSRRRFALPWRRPAAAHGPRRRSCFPYDDAGLPTRQPALASLLPVGLGGFCGCAAALVAIFLLTTGVGIWEIATERPLFGDAAAARFGRTLAAAGRCLDVRSLDSLGGWQAQICLAAAAITAVVIQGLRRHRQDGRRGSHRAWGCLACLFALTSCAAEVPLASLCSALGSDATGLSPGPDGMGWWTMLAGLSYIVCGLWAVLPLSERAVPGAWLTACLAAWAAAAACRWIGPETPRLQAVANVAWMAAATLSAIAMLAAARSVLREVLGLSQSVDTRRRGNAPQRGAPAAGATAVPAHTAAAVENDVEPRTGWGEPPRQAAAEQTIFIDGDEEDDDPSSGRRLSKAERKRLKKLARMGRAA